MLTVEGIFTLYDTDMDTISQLLRCSLQSGSNAKIRHSRKPIPNISAFGVLRSPKIRVLLALETMMPPDFKPIRAMYRPIPALREILMLAGIAFDVPHAIGNFVIALVLFCPLRRLLTNLYAKIQ